MKNNSIGKITPLEQLPSLRKTMGDQRVVLVGGCFDVFHFGHLTFLQAAKKQGDVLVIALESDAYIRKNKKRNPVHTQRERAEILAALTITDSIILLPEMKSDDDYFDLARGVSPHVIAITRGDTQLKNKQKQAARVGATVVEVTPVINNFSTTLIIRHASQT